MKQFSFYVVAICTLLTAAGCAAFIKAEKLDAGATFQPPTPLPAIPK